MIDGARGHINGCFDSAASTMTNHLRLKGANMPDWLRDPKWWLGIVLAILTTSSLYNSYKIYQLTDGKPPITTKKR